jgi:hypothetical protein
MEAARHPLTRAALKKALSVAGCGLGFGGPPNLVRASLLRRNEQTVDENQKAIGTKKQ